MNLGEAVDNLVRRIKRPDKEQDAEDAVNRAIGLFATSNWAHDIVELTANLNSAEYVQAIDITASPFARFRKVKYIRPTGYRQYITYRDPSRIWDNNCESLNVYYRAGNYIKFKLSSLQSTAEMAYYQYHSALITPEATDWMLDQMWPAVQAYALAELHADIGNDADAQSYNKKWPILLQAYKDDIGDGISYG